MISEQEWQAEIDSEISFWRNLINREGKGFGKRFTRKEAIPEFLPDLVQLMTSPEISIADVGCGPVPIVIGQNYRKPVRIVGCDPLSDKYQELMAAHGIAPTVELHSIAGERLLDAFAPESFDVSHIRNALDHSFDPLQIVSNMVDITKPGGLIIVRNIVNEGVRQNYDGLHQWNIVPGSGDFYISDRHGKRFSASERLGKRAETFLIGLHPDASRADMTWMDIVIIKKGATADFIRSVETAFYEAQIALIERLANALRGASRPKVVPIPEPAKKSEAPKTLLKGLFSKK
ncbi:methyltransferase domain-containing protein [Ensifer adhaerens]|uniref:class I SAM-dependent methyltransferase n=1 Tax=Ensifer canadensis TaxID=555315 RepID=UPI00148FCB0D|nr:methyltransferase domain-containing protein [Ensifer canadensis]NOV17890.1 methyltransferase domain-containing protein [Ensifer canadensis]